jgi:hypothetical protein
MSDRRRPKIDNRFVGQHLAESAFSPIGHFGTFWDTAALAAAAGLHISSLVKEHAPGTHACTTATTGRAKAHSHTSP